MIQNGGVSFGLNVPGIEILTSIILLVIVVVAIKQKEWRWGLILLGGGLNLIERLKFGYVTDYWKIPMIPLYNNFNDWLIFGGVVLLIWKYYLKTK